MTEHARSALLRYLVILFAGAIVLLMLSLALRTRSQEAADPCETIRSQHFMQPEQL